MDPRYAVSREEFYNLQMEVKQVQIAQNSYGDRILRLEKRQADDAALKSVWQAPFPGVLGGTPQQNPVPMTSNDVFDDLDDHGEHLLGSLQLGAIDDEPIRRGGAASRANSVRFDESALQGANAGWGGHNNRHSGEFGILRPGSGLMMERSLSHKSDGRHSSAGHSVHSVHSVASGRGSSLGLDTNFMVGGHDDDSPIDIPEPPPGLFVLGSVPTIIRCWLTTDFAHKTLLFADVCTGSRKSTIEYSLLKEFDLVDEIHKDLDLIYRVRLPIFLAEATVSQSHARSGSPGHRIPSITATFDVLGVDQPEHAYVKKAIRLFIGSDILRAHSADLFLSQNRMTLYADDRDKLSVPFATPDDDAVFKHIQTNSNQPEKPKLSATATPFVSGEVKSQLSPNLTDIDASLSRIMDTDTSELMSPNQLDSSSKATEAGTASEVGTEVERQIKDAEAENGNKDTYTPAGSVNGSDKDGGRRESATGIWGSWRAGPGTNGADGGRENGLLSGYQPPGRGSRNMKVLKPQKSSGSNSVRTGGSYEPPPSSRSSGELRRKSLIASVSQENGTAPPPLPTTQSPTVRWEAKRAMANGGGESRAVPPPPLSTQGAQQAPTTPHGSRSASSAGLPRSANPVGGASAFSWMKPTVKGKTPTAVE